MSDSLESTASLSHVIMNTLALTPFCARLAAWRWPDFCVLCFHKHTPGHDEWPPIGEMGNSQPIPLRMFRDLDL